MAHYAFLDENNIVTEIIRGRDEDEIVDGISDWEEYYGKIRGQKCVRTSYNTFGNVHSQNKTPFRYNYAAVGGFFDETVEPNGAFINPKPFQSYILNTQNYAWETPIPKPATVREGYAWCWSEILLQWEELELGKAP